MFLAKNALEVLIVPFREVSSLGSSGLCEPLGASCCGLSLWELASASPHPSLNFTSWETSHPPPPPRGILLFSRYTEHILKCLLVGTHKGREVPVRLKAKFQAMMLFCLFLQLFLHLDPQS